MKAIPRWMQVLTLAMILDRIACAHGSAAQTVLDPPENQHVYRIWSADDGLPQNSVNDIVAARDGYLWLATFGGLIRFDGVEFDLFNISNTENLPSDRIHCLGIDDGGALWIGTSKGLVRYWSGSFENVELQEGVNEIRRIEFHPNGSIWLGTNIGVCVRSAGESEFRLHSQFKGVVSLFFDMDDVAWAGTSSGLVRFDEELPTLVSEFSITQWIWDISGTDDQGLLLGTENGAFLMNREGLLEKLSDGPVHLVERDPENRIWIGGESPLLVGTLSEHRERKATRPKLIGNPATGSPLLRGTFCTLRDGGGLWIGMRGAGLIRLEASRICRWTSSEINSTEAGPLMWFDDDLWCRVGPDLFVRGNETDGFLPIPQPEVVGAVHSCEYDPERAWVSYGSCIQKLGKNSRWVIEDESALPSIKSLYYDRSHVLWAGTLSGLYFIENEVSNPIEDPLFDGESILSLTEDDHHRLWVGTSRGLARIGENRRDIAWFGPEQGLGRGDVRSIHIDDEGTAWVGTYGGGLSRIQEDHVKTFTMSDGLRENVVSAILEDREGYLWLLGNRCLSWIHRRELDSPDGFQANLNVGYADAADGFIEGTWRGQPSAAQDSNGHMWFGSIHGLLRVDPEKLRAPTSRPRSYIRSIQSDGLSRTTFGDAVEINAQHGDVEIAYGAISHFDPEKTQFQYRLLPMDETWIDVGKSRSVTCRGLDSGEYSFQIRARKPGTEWPEDWNQIGFKVPTVFHKTTLGRSILALSGLILIGTIVMIVGSKRRQNEKDRLQLMAQRERSNRLEALGSLAGGLAHNINNSLQVIVGCAELTKLENEGNEPLVSSMDSILLTTERAKEVVEGIQLFSPRKREKPSVVSVDRVVQKTHQLLIAAFGARRRLKLHIDDAPLWCFGDEASVQQAIANLVVNAMDSLKNPDDPVRIRVKRALISGSIKDVVLPASPGDYVCITVEDSGCGMDEYTAERAFNPFFSTSETHHVGLGLPVVHGLIESLGGGISMTTEANRGTSICLFLKSSDDPEGGSENGSERSEMIRELNIVLIDDDQHVLDSLTKSLQKQGCRVEGFSCAEAALESLEPTGLGQRVIVTDEDMPNLKGHQLAIKLRERGILDPVVLLSGTGAPSGHWQDNVVCLHVSKPISGSDLAQRIAHLALNGAHDHSRGSKNSGSRVASRDGYFAPDDSP